MEGHVELRFVGGRGAHQLALGVGRHNGTVGQGEAIQRAERMALSQDWRERDGETEREGYGGERDFMTCFQIWALINRRSKA